MTFLKVLAVTLVGLLAPFVTLVYRDGWFNTPDDPVSPRGLGNEKVRHLHTRYGACVSDWWWLGVRNRACGLAYALKPAAFKGLVYADLMPSQVSVRWSGRIRTIEVLGHKERAVDFGRFHVLYGYRLAPVFNELRRNWYGGQSVWDVPHRPINLDARPIFSIRSGRPD